MNHGDRVSAGFTGQYGSEPAIIQAAQPIPATSNAWQRARASRGRTTEREMSEPAVLPRPRPMRNTARMMENV